MTRNNNSPSTGGSNADGHVDGAPPADGVPQGDADNGLQPPPNAVEFTPGALVRPILRTAFFSPRGIEVIVKYFQYCEDEDAVWGRLHHLLSIEDDRRTSTALQRFGDVDPADLNELKTLRGWFQKSALPTAFQWGDFSSTMYRGGIPMGPSEGGAAAAPQDSAHDDSNVGATTHDASGHTLGNTGDAAGDPHSFVTDPDLAAMFNAGVDTPDTRTPRARPARFAPSPVVPTRTGGCPDFYEDIRREEAANRAKYKNTMPYGADLGPHPTWKVWASARVHIDLRGFSDAYIPKLSSLEPHAICTWYNHYQQVASQFGVHVIPLSMYRVDCVVFPSSLPSATIAAINNAHFLKLTTPGTLEIAPDTPLALHSQAFLQERGHEMLSAFNFLHRVLQYTVTAPAAAGLPVPPKFVAANGIIGFATALMAFLNQHGSAHQYSPRRAAVHFLDEVGRAGHNVRQFREMVLAVPEHAPLPDGLHVGELAVKMADASDSGRTAHAVTRSQRKGVRFDDERSEGRKSRSPERSRGRRDDDGEGRRVFRQPAPGAVCDACGRRGHHAESCIFLARHRLLAQYCEKHAELADKLSIALRRIGKNDARRAIARLLKVDDGDAEWSSEPSDEELLVAMMHLEQDFP